jgi:hypothetical protein
MAVQYLFNSSGSWIAFRVGKCVFDTKCHWIGWMPWDDTDVVTTEGEYLGTIVENDRFYRFGDKPSRDYPGHPGCPGHPDFPGHPGYLAYSPLPPNAEDIRIPEMPRY